MILSTHSDSMYFKSQNLVRLISGWRVSLPNSKSTSYSYRSSDIDVHSVDTSNTIIFIWCLFFQTGWNLLTIVDFVLIRTAFSCSGRIVLFLVSKFQQFNRRLYLKRYLGLYRHLHYFNGFHSGGQIPWCMTRALSSGISSFVVWSFKILFLF
jgi:hypothetical protein